MEINKKIKSSLLFNCAIVCSVLSILLPAHPGLQQPLRSIGFPPELLSLVLATGIIFVGIKKHLFFKQVIVPVFLYISFAFIILTRSVASPALGQDNYLQSLRGILILSPFAILSVLASRHSPKVASFAIFFMGLLTVSLYIYYILFSDLLSISGFRSLSSQSDQNNYQATAFYVGLAAIGFMVSIDYYKSFLKLLTFLGFLLTIILMATIGARASIMAIGFCFFIHYLSSFFFSFRKWIWLSLGLLLLLLYLNNETISASFSVVERFLYLFEGEDSSNRIMLFSSAIALWLNSPLNFFFGAGLGAFPAYIGKIEPGWYPHNFILEILSEGGIFAALPIFLLIIIVVKLFILDIKSGNIELERVYLGYCAIYSIVVYSFTGGLNALWIPVFFIYSYIMCKRKYLND